MNPHDLIREVLAHEKAVTTAERLGWPAWSHGCLRARAEAWKRLEATLREEAEAQNKYWSSFE